MAKFKICECCGAHLDFGERCDCRESGGASCEADGAEDQE